MSLPHQGHHPHTPGEPPNAHLFDQGGAGCSPGEYLPPALELAMASVYVRHGERAPVRKRLTSAGLPAVFPLCSLGKEFKASVLGFDQPAVAAASTSPWGQPEGVQDVAVRRLTEEQGKGHTPTPGNPKDCAWGELTDLGKQSTLTLGKLLRGIYVDKLGLVPATLQDIPRAENAVQFRSTAVPRAIETLHSLVAGLFPLREGPVEFVVRQPSDESLYPNSLCSPMAKLDKRYADEAAKEWNPTLEQFDPIFTKYLNGTALRVDSSPRANGILDTLAVSKAHNYPLPADLNSAHLFETLEKAVVAEWFTPYRSLEFAKLSMGRLLGDLRQTMQEKVDDPLEKKHKLRLAIYSCHDTSLGGILRALDVFDNKWPPFTSHVAVELLRKQAPPPTLLQTIVPALRPTAQSYVRLRYNGRTMKLPVCQEKGKHLEGTEGEVCTFEAFSEAVRKVEMTGEEWTKKCSGG